MSKHKRHTIIKEDDDNKDNKKKKIMFIIILIIIILSLISSCSCTSNFFGVIGNMFRNEGDYEIDDEPHNEVIKNKDLKFVKDKLEINLGDSKAKLGFYYKNIKPTEFTCTTSDADIASCYVEDDYVVINSYKAGKVTVNLQTKTNGKTYLATATVTITDNSDKGIKLYETSGNINLAYEKTKNVAYTLNGIKGEVTASSSDESIATAVIENGVLKITAYKVGEVKITLNINYNGTNYSSVYTLKVTNYINDGSSTKPGTPSTPDKPSKPSEPSGPTESEKDSDSSLISLKSNKGELNFESTILEYDINVSWLTTRISLEAIAKNGTISYQYKRADEEKFSKVDDLKSLKLKTGKNIVLITVTSKDGKNKTVYRVNVNKETGNYIKKISSDDIDIKFDKKIQEYKVETTKDKISLKVEKDNKDQEVSYTFRGKPVKDLNNLQLLPGTNVIEVITKHDDEERVYTIKVIKKDGEVDNNSSLASLTDSLGKIKFNANIYDYYMPVENKVTSFALSASSESKNATVTIEYNGQKSTNTNVVSAEIKDLQVGKNNIKVTVKNGKNETSYNIVVEREAPSDVNADSSLISLTTNKGELKFDPTILEYDINVSWLTTRISLEAIAKNGTISYQYKRADEEKFSKVDDLKSLKLKTGKNIVLITVTSKDGKNKTVYRVNVNKETGNYIKKISSDDIDIKFDKKIQEYKVETTKDKISLKVEKEDKNQEVSYTFRGKPVKDLNNLQLLPGTNVIEVITKHDDEERVYTIKVIKKDGEVDNNSSLASLTDSLGKIKFNANIYDYYMPVGNKVTSFILSASSENKNATVTIEYNGQKSTNTNVVSAEIKDLQVGKNNIKVTVKNGKNETSYNIIVDRARKAGTEEGNDKLVNLIVGDGMSFDRPFNPNYLYYTVYVGNTKQLSFTMVVDSNSEASYCYNDKCEKNEWTKGTNINIKDLEYGSNTVLVKVNQKGNTSSEDGTTYKIEIIRDGNREDGIAELSEINVNGTKVDLNDSLEGKANVEISSIGEVSFKAIAKYDGTVSTNPENINEYLTNLAPGESAKVEVTVTSKDKDNTKTYTVNVTKKDDAHTTDNMAVLKELVINGISVDIDKALAGTAEVEIEESQEVTFKATADYEGTISYNVPNVQEHLTNLAPGASTEIVITVTSKDEKVTKDYKVKVTKKKEVPKKDSIAKVREIVINGTKVNLDEAGTDEGTNIEISAEGATTFDAITEYEGTISPSKEEIEKKLNELAPGTSTEIIVTVTSKDTTATKDYKIIVTKKEKEPPVFTHKAEFTNVPTCTLGSECQVTYRILDHDGNDVTTSYEGEVTASLSGGNIDVDYSTRGIIKFTPKITSISDQTLTLSIGTDNNVTTTIKFERPDYTLDVQSDNGNLPVNVPDSNEPNGKVSLITHTNMFDTISIENINAENGVLKITSTDPDNASITVSTDSDIITLAYNKHNTDDSTYLPIQIEVDKDKLDQYLDANPGIIEPSFNITVKGNLYGNEKTETVKLKVSRTYTVTINSGEGIFTDEVDSEGNPDNTRTITVVRGGSNDLSTIEIPYVTGNIPGDNVCVTIVRKFKEYQDEFGNTISKIENITRDMTLTAQYIDKSESPEDRPDYPLKTFWLTLDGNDENGLFYTKQPNRNKDEFFEKNKGDIKLIYPGISGDYTMNITNTIDSKNSIIIKGLILEEQTICVEQGCVNMGFQVKSGGGNTPATSTPVVHFGDDTKQDDNGKYLVLNSVKPEDSTNSKIKTNNFRDLSRNYGTNRVDIAFAEDTNANTTLNADDYMEITLHWKWVEKDDKLDTAIGNIASKMDVADNVYSIKVGIQYVEVCK